MIEPGVNVSVIDEEAALPWKTSRQGRFHVSAAYSDYFPTSEFSAYDDFFNIAGKIVKQGHRTQVMFFNRPASEGANEGSYAFVVKIYHYPKLARIRTGLRISKAENEFNSLHYLRQLGIAAVEPVAHGVKRTRLGLVRSCFIITRHFDQAITLADWHWQNHDKEESWRRAARLKRLGAIFRRLHSKRFFLFTAKPRNILLRPDPARDDDLHLIDTPYAWTLKWLPLARWAQGRDLGFCLGSFQPKVTDEDLESFYAGYLPDILGRSEKSVRRRIGRAIRAQQNLTPLAAVVEAVKHYLRAKRRMRDAQRAISK